MKSVSNPSIKYNPIVLRNLTKLSKESLQPILARKTMESDPEGNLVSTLVMAVNTENGEIREVSGKRPDIDPLKPEVNVYLQVIYRFNTNAPKPTRLRFIDSEFLKALARENLQATIHSANCS